MHTSATRRNQISLRKLFVLIIALFSIAVTSHSQSAIDSLLARIDPQKLSAIVEKKVCKLENRIIAKSEKTLRQLEKQEKRIWERQLETKDSLLAKAKLAEIETKYKSLQDQLKNPTSVLHNTARQYIPHLDTLKTAFKFLDQNGTTKNIKDALSRIESFEGKMQQAEEIKKFIRERREQLKYQLEQLGLVKELKKYNKEIFYYQEQLKEYKSILNDSRKIEKKAIELLSKTKVFQDFLKKNSLLASLFRMPGDPTDPSYVASLPDCKRGHKLIHLFKIRLLQAGQMHNRNFQQIFSRHNRS
ncbi:MAG TPA: hypothetical protein VGQ09_05105 [Chitinophagaceae bacterium]|jgi:hypothetical protein|nr:hypothetical protein [Chitinophagaceae bacterium]